MKQASLFLALINWHREKPAACEDFCLKCGGANLLEAVKTAAEGRTP